MWAKKRYVKDPSGCGSDIWPYIPSVCLNASVNASEIDVRYTQSLSRRWSSLLMQAKCFSVTRNSYADATASRGAAHYAAPIICLWFNLSGIT